MSIEIQTLDSLQNNSLGKIFRKIDNYIDNLNKSLFSSSSPMTTADKIGLMTTIILFGVIIFPIATSDSDPYHLKWIFAEITNQIPLMQKSFENQGNTQYTVIIHLNSPSELHFDATEKIILGKYRALPN